MTTDRYRADRPPLTWLVLLFAIVCIGVVGYLLHRRDRATVHAPSSNASIVVVGGVGPPTARASGTYRVLPEPADVEDAVVDIGAVRRALSLPEHASIIGSHLVDRDQRLVCGMVETDGGAGLRRFIYSGAAQLAMIDNGGSDFDQANKTLCDRADQSQERDRKPTNQLRY